MFKRVIQSCVIAAAVSACSVLPPALGVQINGTYTGQGPAGPASVDLQSSGGSVRGMIHDQTGDHAVVAKITGNYVIGSLEYQGRQQPFSAMVTDNGLLVAPNSNHPFQLARAGGGQPQGGQFQPQGGQVQPQRGQFEPQGGQFQANQADAGQNASQPAQINAQMSRGQNFDFPLPQGWQVKEANNTLILSSPDGSMRVSECVEVWNAPGTPTPEAIAGYVLQHAGATGIQVLSKQPIQVANGQAVMAEISFQSQGAAYRGVVYSHLQGDRVCRLIMVQASPESFDQVRGSLTQIASSIQLTRPGEMGTARSAIAAIDPMLGANAMYRSGQAQLQNEDASWRYKQDSLAETSLQRQDTTMGYYRYDQHTDGTLTPHNYNRSQPYPAAGQ